MDREMNLHPIRENRLRSIIEKANSWDRNVEGALYAHTDAPEDTLRPRGAPCLQYVQFRLFDDANLELLALYRAHDFLNKVLGNMIGLQRLGTFVAAQTGRHFVRQTVISLHPCIEGSKQRLGDFIERVEALPEF
jgi:thymidylate synthase